MRTLLSTVVFVLLARLAPTPAHAADRPPLPPMPDRRAGELWTPPAEEERFPEAGLVGERAPDFTLQTLDGAELTLSEAVRERPVVLLFGSYSCPVLRSQLPAYEQLSQRFGDKATFVFVYVREAHPGSRVYLKRDGREILDVVRQTATRAEREQRARDTRETFGLDHVVLADADDNAVSKAYSGWPVRAVVVGKDGVIKYKSYEGPWGFWPNELEQWLEANAGG